MQGMKLSELFIHIRGRLRAELPFKHTWIELKNQDTRIYNTWHDRERKKEDVDTSLHERRQESISQTLPVLMAYVVVAETPAWIAPVQSSWVMLRIMVSVSIALCIFQPQYENQQSWSWKTFFEMHIFFSLPG